MMWKVEEFLRDYGIPINYERPKWVNIKCPFCGDGGMHGGFHIHTGHYNCWRCGHHPIYDVLKGLLNLSVSDIKQILSRYKALQTTDREEERTFAQTFDLPGSELGAIHRKYLTKRGFDPDRIVSEYGVKGTGIGQICWKTIDYAYRLVIPLHDPAGRIIGCQGRDVTGKHDLRYIASPLDHSLGDYKKLVYGAHKVYGNSVGVVEGVFDAWKLGPGFVATYGTALKQEQIQILSKWDRIYFLFDGEEAAQDNAMKYAAQLAAFGKSVEVIDLELGDKDPGDLSESEAFAIRRELGFK